MSLCSPAPKGRSRRSSEARLTNQRVFEPMVEDECAEEPLLNPSLITFLLFLSTSRPCNYLLTRSAPFSRVLLILWKKKITTSSRRPQQTEDGEHTPVEYPPPLMSTPTSKPMVIGATIARFYDMAASETSASLPHPTPSTYYNRRHEKEKEKQRELSRNNSSGGTGRVALSRIRALQEKLVPESGDEAERARSSRRQLLNAILADAPTPQPTPAPHSCGSTPTCAPTSTSSTTSSHCDITCQRGCTGD
jgi:hypothetical protein